MITDQDIKNLTKYQLEIFKDVFVTTDAFDAKIDKLQISIDGLVKDVKIIKDEKLISEKRLKNVENWVDDASPKLGLKFEH